MEVIELKDMSVDELLLKAQKNSFFVKDRDIVILPLREYKALEETIYLMKSKKNYDWIKKSIENAKKGNITYKEIE